MDGLVFAAAALVVAAGFWWRWDDIVVRARNASVGPARLRFAAERALRRSRLPDVDGSGGTVDDLVRVLVPARPWEAVRDVVHEIEGDLSHHLAKIAYDLGATVRSDIVVKVVKGGQRQRRVKVKTQRTAASGKVLVELEPSAGGAPVLLDRPETLVGRDPAQADLLLDVDTVTRRHAKVMVRGDGDVEVLDLGSTNGTWVNERRLAAGETVRVRSGDWLLFADQEFRVMVQTPVPFTDVVIDLGAATVPHHAGGGDTPTMEVGA
jgi:hypothetical protein